MVANQTQKFQGIDRNDIAYKMVQKMGWTEGNGLGKDNSGITKHLWTKKRVDSIGIGAETSNDWGAHSVQTNVYNSLLSKLSVIVNNSDSDSSSSSSESSENKTEGVKAITKKSSTAPSVTDEPASKRQEKKKIQSGSSDDDNRSKGNSKPAKAKGVAASQKAAASPSSSESSSSSESESDTEVRAASSSTDAHAARKAGRSYAAAAVMAQRFAYKRAFRNKTKDVKSYSSEDLSQILGFAVPQSPAAPASPAPSPAPAVTNRSVDAGKPMSDALAAVAAVAEATAAIAARIRREQRAPVGSVLKGLLAHMFAAGGFLDNDPSKADKEQDWEFNEATQEKIATDAHKMKVENRKGLGFDSDRPSKLGKDFKGARIAFGSDDSDAAEGEAAAGDAEAAEDGKEERRRGRREQRRAEATKAQARDTRLLLRPRLGCWPAGQRFCCPTASLPCRVLPTGLRLR